MKLKLETSAGGIVYKKEGEKIFWLLTQHSQSKGWGFPKGLIGDKVRTEPKEVAALREVQEEGGVKATIIHPEPITINYMYRFQEYLVKKIVHYFIMEYISGDPKDHDWEVQEAEFLTTEEARERLSYKSDKEAFEKACELIKTGAVEGI